MSMTALFAAPGPWRSARPKGVKERAVQGRCENERRNKMRSLIQVCGTSRFTHETCWQTVQGGPVFGVPARWLRCGLEDLAADVLRECDASFGGGGVYLLALGLRQAQADRHGALVAFGLRYQPIESRRVGHVNPKLRFIVYTGAYCAASVNALLQILHRGFAVGELGNVLAGHSVHCYFGHLTHSQPRAPCGWRLTGTAGIRGSRLAVGGVRL